MDLRHPGSNCPPPPRFSVIVRHLRDFVAGNCTAAAATALPAIPVTIVEFGAGDVFIFRPDVIHAGDAFEEENVRCHCFLDTAALRGYVRRENGTFIPSDAVASAHYVPLGECFLPHPDDAGRAARFESAQAAAHAARAAESGPTGLEQLMLAKRRAEKLRTKPPRRRRNPTGRGTGGSGLGGSAVSHATGQLTPVREALLQPDPSHSGGYSSERADAPSSVYAAAPLFDAAETESMAMIDHSCYAMAVGADRAVGVPGPTLLYAVSASGTAEHAGSPSGGFEPVAAGDAIFDCIDPDCKFRNPLSAYYCCC